MFTVPNNSPVGVQTLNVITQTPVDANATVVPCRKYTRYLRDSGVIPSVSVISVPQVIIGSSVDVVIVLASEVTATVLSELSIACAAVQAKTQHINTIILKSFFCTLILCSFLCCRYSILCITNNPILPYRHHPFLNIGYHTAQAMSIYARQILQLFCICFVQGRVWLKSRQAKAPALRSKGLRGCRGSDYALCKREVFNALRGFGSICSGIHPRCCR